MLEQLITYIHNFSFREARKQQVKGIKYSQKSKGFNDSQFSDFPHFLLYQEVRPFINAKHFNISEYY